MSSFQQFYVKPAQVFGDHLLLTGDEAFHAARVLRHKKGDFIHAVDGRGVRFSGTIIEIDAEMVEVKITSTHKNVGEPSLRVVLAQSVPKGSHFDWVIEKGTEIGICEFQPVLTRYSILNSANRIHRWQQKALAAMKQCGRSFCPLVHEPVEFDSYVRGARGRSVFIAHDSETQPLSASNLMPNSRAVILVGPEGGFAGEEVKLAVSFGARAISLGKRRLRSETAGLVAAVKLLHLAGDM